MIDAVRLLRPHLRPYRRSLMIGLLAMVGEIITALLLPIPIQQVIDRVVRPQAGGGPIELDASRWQVLGVLIALAVAVAVLDAVFTYLDLRQTTEVSQRAVNDLRSHLFEHVQRLSLSYHQNPATGSGDLLLRMSSDVQALVDFSTTSLSNLITNGGTALLMVGLLFFVDIRPALLVLAVSVPLFLLLRHIHLNLRRVTRMARLQEGRVSSMVSESLGAARLVQAFGRERQDAARMRSETSAGLDFALQAGEYQARALPVVALATSLCLAGVLLWGAILTVHREITLGQLTLILAYSRSVFGALRQLAKLATQSQKASAAAERINELLAQTPTVVSPAHPVPLPIRRALDISFDKVSFAYDEGPPVLRDVDLYVPAGSTLAIVGPTGAGKSTLVSLIVRFFDVTAGELRVGGVDVRDLALEELRGTASLVLQETLLFRDTLWNNIAFARPDAGGAAIYNVAALAGVTRFVDDLEDGFATVIGERGSTLSGGQRQCVGIARAMLRDSPIVILDEPTSSLDVRTEGLVLDAFKQLLQRRTAIIIAHRFSTIRDADLVAVMDGGRVVEFGTPAELQRANGLFRQLSGLQWVAR